MASAIACACDNLEIDANAFLMVHNPWTMTIGNAGDLRKEAEVLDQYRDALLAIYRSKFDCGEAVITKMLDDETWIIGEAAPMFALKCEVIPTAEPLRAAAFGKKTMPAFLHTPKALADLTTEIKVDMENTETKLEQEIQEAVEVAEATAEAAEPVVEKKDEEPKEELVAKAEVEKRVSGMQSAMAKQMDALKKDYEAKIADFEIQLRAKSEELTKAQADVTSLADNLEKTTKELSDMTSAYAEKADALAALNASVNTPNECENWKALKGKAFFDWYRRTH